MTNTNRRTITVYGATGAQGGPVARSLLKNNAFKVRAITRKPESEAAKALADLGAEIVQGDGWKKEQMVAAFSGSWAAFLNTNSDDPCFWGANHPTEFDLGKIIVDGIIQAGTVKHLVYSSFVDTSSFTNGQAIIEAADEKSKIERYAASSGHFDTVCPLYQGWYMDVFRGQEYAHALGGFPYFEDEDKFRTLRLPRWGTHTDMPLPWISLEDDFGDIVHGIFLAPEDYNGRVVPTVSDIRTYPEMIDAFQSATGQKARYIPVTDWEAHFGDSHQGKESLTIFKFGKFTNGKYFGDEPISTDISATLKAKAAEAQGKDPSDRKLITLVEWFEKHVAPLL